VTHGGACSCGAVRFSIEGPVRDVIVCHCAACRGANGGGPWSASAARRRDLVLEDETALEWEKAPVSSYGASRGRCRACGAYVLWDAPGRETVSFGAGLLDEGDDLGVAAHIWVPAQEREALRTRGIPAYAEGMPDGVRVSWQDETPATA
jgi:hypothetical protein